MIRIGTCKVNITPYIGCPLGGFAARKDVSQGIHDELYARILVIEQQEPVAIVAADLLCLPAEMVKQVKALAARKIGICEECIAIAATHTHSGPELRPNEKEIASAAYMQNLIDDLAGGIYAAWSVREPARIGVGCGTIQGIGVNRRHPDGLPVDPQVGVLRFDFANGRPGGVLINYTCHPVVLGPDNLLITADYPGYATRLMERVKGDGFLSMFTNGATGDINTGHSADLSALGYPIPGRTFERAEKLGNMLAGEVLKIFETIELQSEIVVVAKSKTIALKLKPLPSLEQVQNDLIAKQAVLQQAIAEGASEEQLLKARVNKFYAELLLDNVAQQAKAPQQETLEIELQGIKIGNCALLAFPGELFVEIGLAIKQNSPFAQTCILGYTNGYIGYLPTAQTYEEGGYEAVASRFTPESAQVVAREAVEVLRSLDIDI
ncbi:hypothetical protein U27_03324 [Candidatus Vecturithrix granuli]|uniref:Neutral ceramidase n=1 Tax=Vecturithrix granuli TaxID=1499967 RepID=A0A081BVK7_VECG1|nr:hypothetical protein U27_03324 [Candidatus Vecturithrix granuli]